MRKILFVLLAALFIAGDGIGSSTWTKEAGIRIDSQDCVSPSAIFLKDGRVRVFYGGGSVKSAVSSDGLTFKEERTCLAGIPGNTLEAMAGNPHVIRISEDTLRMYYEGRPSMGPRSPRYLLTAISKDEGATWQRQGLVLKPEALDNNFLSVPNAVKLPNGKIRLYFVTAGSAIGTAISSDGIKFIRESGYRLGQRPTGPGMPEDCALDPEIIILPDRTFKLYYATGWSKSAFSPTKIMSATSSDGLKFKKDNIVIVSTGGDYDQAGIVDPTILKFPDGLYRMYYGGTNTGKGFRLLSAVSSIP